MTKKEAQENYSRFRENYTQNLQMASNLLKKKLNYSLDEIDNWTKIYHHFLENPKEYQVTHQEMLDIFIAYIGEAWKQHFGGKWFYSDYEKDKSYGYPQVTDWGPQGYYWVAASPKTWAQFIEKGHPFSISDLMRRDYKSIERFKQKNISN